MKSTVAILSVFITLPIWFYILYQILTAITASELTWFLYWAYVPVSLLTTVLFNLGEDS